MSMHSAAVMLLLFSRQFSVIPFCFYQLCHHDIFYVTIHVGRDDPVQNDGYFRLKINNYLVM